MSHRERTARRQRASGASQPRAPLPQRRPRLVRGPLRLMGDGWSPQRCQAEIAPFSRWGDTDLEQATALITIKM